MNLPAKRPDIEHDGPTVVDYVEKSTSSEDYGAFLTLWQL